MQLETAGGGGRAVVRRLASGVTCSLTKGGGMKFLLIAELADTSDEERKKVLGLYAEHGAPSGMEGLWVTADGQHVVQLMELDDLTEVSKFSNWYRTGFRAGSARWYPLVDAEVAVAQQAEGVELRLGAS